MASKPNIKHRFFSFSTTYFRDGNEYDIEGNYTVIVGDEHNSVCLAGYECPHDLTVDEECEIEDEIAERFLADDLADYQADYGDYLHEQERDRRMERGL